MSRKTERNRERKRQRAARQPNYSREPLRVVTEAQLSPGLHHVEIAHDRWCAQLAGRGPCDCSPIIGGLMREQ